MKKYFRRPALLLPFIFSTLLHAQENSTGVYPQWGLRTLPSSFLDIDAGLMLGVNYRWSQSFSASIEPTWIFFNALVTPDNSRRVYPSGIKIRADLRWHFRGEILGMDGYLAPDFHFKSIQTKRLGEFGINCQNGSCAYFQSAYYKEIKQEIGGFLKMGALKSISQNRRWLLEFYAGIGVKQMKFRETGLPTGGSFLFPPERLFPESIFTGDDRNSFSMPMLPGGIKLIFVMR